MNITSKQIHKNLKKIAEFRLANSIGMYYPIGSEVPTQDIIQEALSNGKEIFSEGITILNDTIYQLSWENHLVF